jgi:hypothetical protein
MANVVSIRRMLGMHQSGGPADWQKVLAFILVWGAALVFTLSRITVSNVHEPRLWTLPVYHLKYGYTYSLSLLFLPLLALVWWYILARRHDRDGSLQRLIRAVINNVLVTGLGFVIFDSLFATLLFTFPDPHSVIGIRFWGYTWAGNCSTLWRIYLPSCYEPTIPVEEALFYVAGAAVLRGMYIWASEDFLAQYTIPHERYVEDAKHVGRLLSVSRGLLALTLGILAVGVYVKQQHGGGVPVYLLLNVFILLAPVVFLYAQVRHFVNTRALLMIMVVQMLVNVIWETTALPYGWWGYQPAAMIGSSIRPWSDLPIEACVFWIAVGWSAIFLHETTKIKVRSGRSWRSILTGQGVDEIAVAGFQRPGAITGRDVAAIS